MSSQPEGGHQKIGMNQQDAQRALPDVAHSCSPLDESRIYRTTGKHVAQATRCLSTSTKLQGNLLPETRLSVLSSLPLPIEYVTGIGQHHRQEPASHLYRRRDLCSSASSNSIAKTLSKYNRGPFSLSLFLSASLPLCHIKSSSSRHE